MTRMMLPTAMVNGTLNGQSARSAVSLTFITPLYGSIISGNSGVLA
jgi:hypothetical protein